MKLKILIFFALSLSLARASVKYPHEIYEKVRCSTLSCIHSSALILQRIDLDFDPCEDFYQYACGSYSQESHTPDEKTSVDIGSLMYENLIEYLLRIFEYPRETSNRTIHKYAQNFFDSCMDARQVNSNGLKDLGIMLKELGGFPLAQANWNESKFEGWADILTKFRKYVNNATDNIFNYKRPAKDKEDNVKSLKEVPDEGDIKNSLHKLVLSILTNMGTDNINTTSTEVDDLIEFDRNITEYYLKFKRFRKLVKLKKLKEAKSEKIKTKMKEINRLMSYIDLMEKGVFTTAIKFEDEDIPNDFNRQFVEFIENTPKRILANFIFWRLAQVSLSFTDKDTRNLVLTFKKNAFGNEDNEQRWVYCTELVANVAPVAAGSIYIDGYFFVNDKQTAEELVDYIIQAYIDSVRKSEWMDDETKQKTIDYAMKMHRYIGYHEKMRAEEGYTFYDSIPFRKDNFLLTGLSFKVFATDREFKRLHTPDRKKGYLEDDWTKYARPATVNAFYNDRDNSIQFPAGILQLPNFDRDRPPFMNFGAIGSVVGHETTHAFDELATDGKTFDEVYRKRYKEITNCILKEYNETRVTEIEEYLNDGKPFYLNGTLTEKEDLADMGGIYLAYKAWTNFEKDHGESRIRPLGLEGLPNKKMFWISYAQTYCSVDRPAAMKNKVENNIHTIEKYRVNIPLKNMKEFSEVWGCKPGAPMNPKKKCTIW